MENVKRFYMTIFSVVSSPSPGFLAAGNNYGGICIFNLGMELGISWKGEDMDIEEKESDENTKTSSSSKVLEESVDGDFSYIKPIFRFTAHNATVYSLVSTKNLLISGSIGEISAWRWDDILSEVKKCVWCIRLPQSNNLVQTEVNSLAISNLDDNIVYAGSGDDKIYCCDIESGTIKFTLTGHVDYIHCIKAFKESTQIASASEDGSVRLWDPVRTKEAVSVIEPYKHLKVNRQQHGKWVGCVDVDDNKEWMVCGGAPSLGMWDLRSLLPCAVYSKPKVQFHVACFYNDRIISGGTEHLVNHWSLNGDLIAEVPTSSTAVFDLKIASPESPALCASGTSNKIDIYKDFRIKAFSLWNDL